MGKSFKHTPMGGVCSSPSEKAEKVYSHKAVRAAARSHAARDQEVPFLLEEVSNPWNMSKDGKSYYGAYAYEHPHILRK